MKIEDLSYSIYLLFSRPFANNSMLHAESTGFHKYSIYHSQNHLLRETICENRLNMLDTAKKVNSKVK